MIRQRIFEYAVLYHPEEKRDKDGNVMRERSELLVDVTRVLASDEKEVATRAARALDEAYLDKLDLVEIVVRPF